MRSILKKLNGFKYGEFEIYPCDKAIDFNKKDKHYFNIGRKNKKHFAYAPETGKYVVCEINESAFMPVRGHDIKGRPTRVRKAEKNIPVYNVIEIYDSFADMFKIIMKGWT